MGGSYPTVGELPAVLRVYVSNNVSYDTLQGALFKPLLIARNCATVVATITGHHEVISGHCSPVQ